MPAVSAPATVLVTGANGYIAIYVVKYLLERGFKVRGTVRSFSKGEFVKKMYEAYGDKFECVVVEDFVKPGAFDEAVKGVDAIAHVGAPLPKANNDIDEMIKPTVEGAVSILDSARKAGTVKRVIITSTAIAVLQPKEGRYDYTEEDWNEAALDYFYKNGSNTPSPYVYGASKMLAERTAFNYVKTNKDDINFDVATILPAWVFGPPIQEVKTVEEVAFGSTEIMYNGFTQNGKSPEWVQPTTCVDVRDVAELHVVALMNEAAGGQRILANGGNFHWQNAFDALNAVRPTLVGVPIGTPGSAKDFDFPLTLDSTKSKELLGYKYRSMEETFQDSWIEFVRRGWLKSEPTST